MFTTTDMMGQHITLAQFPPKKIVSVVPSQTELLFDLGLEDEVVGLTKFCIHPDKWFRKKTRVGGTKNLNFETIRSLEPDIIIANKEENLQEEIEKLQEDFQVWVSDIQSIEDALQMIIALGLLTRTTEKAVDLHDRIASGFNQIKNIKKGSVLYLIWQNPFMVAANDNYIHEILEHLGYTNCSAHLHRYPTLSAEEIVQLQPDHIFLSSEPYPFKEKHLSYFQNLCPDAQVRLVDGEFFSWYGSRMLKAVDYFGAF